MDPEGENPQTQDVRAPVEGQDQSDMSLEEKNLALVAYKSVLRALMAQSDELSWEKEAVITELRKQLNVSNDDHCEMLKVVKSDDHLRRIKNLRKGANAVQPVSHKDVELQNVANEVARPTISAKRANDQKMPGSGNAFGAPSPSLHPHSVAVGVPTLEPGPPPRFPPRLNMIQPFKMVGWRLWIRWSAPSNICEAVITGYNPENGQHSLMYTTGRTNATVEWIDLKQVSPKDIKFMGPHVDHKKPQRFQNRKRGRPPKRANAKPTSSSESANIYKGGEKNARRT